MGATTAIRRETHDEVMSMTARPKAKTPAPNKPKSAVSPSPPPPIAPELEPAPLESAERAFMDRLSAFFDWLRTGIGFVSSLATLIMVTLTVIFLLIPALKPEASSNQFDATLSDARIETGVVLSNYYARIGQTPPASLSAAELGAKGAVASFTVVLDGFQGRACRVVWSVFDAKTNARVASSWLVDRPGWPSDVFTPAGSRDQGNGQTFVPYPPASGSYFVRIELRDPNGTPLTTIDTPPFDVAAESAPGPAGLPTEPGP